MGERNAVTCADIEAAAAMDQPEPSSIEISDHAVVQYLRRAYRMDIDAVRREMAGALRPAVDFGASVVKVHGVRLILSDGVYCVTALPGRKR